MADPSPLSVLLVDAPDAWRTALAGVGVDAGVQANAAVPSGATGAAASDAAGSIGGGDRVEPGAGSAATTREPISRGDVDADATPPPDAALIVATGAAAFAALRDGASFAAAVRRTAVVVATDQRDDAIEAALLEAGAQAIVDVAAAPVALARALRHAVVRRRVEAAAQHAWATDLATGLPHEAQLVEHLTQLLALRERQPAPMALAALRVAFDHGVGGASLDVLRRKLAVRLRAGLRASDVVAALAPDTYAVLMVQLKTPADAKRVVAKLLRALQQPLAVAGQTVRVAVRAGLALVPDHGKDAATLLARAVAQATGATTDGAQARAVIVPFAGGADAAANDAP